MLSFNDLMRILAKNHTSQNFRYYYVITEIGKLVISRWYTNSGKSTDIIIWGYQVNQILILMIVLSSPSKSGL
jgi:hypothetical protein